MGATLAEGEVEVECGGRAIGFVFGGFPGEVWTIEVIDDIIWYFVHDNFSIGYFVNI